MSIDFAINLLIVTAIILANLPWIMARHIFLFFPLKQEKTLGIVLLEMSAYFLMTVVLGYLLEGKTMGNHMSQAWEFWVTVVFLFMIFSFPGFIYRYNLRKFFHKSHAHKS